MSCKPTYKGIRYNSLEELYRANGINSEQKQQALQLYSQYLENLSTNNIKPGVTELFENDPELANSVYEALGFKEQQYVSKLKEIAGRRKLATKSDLENSQLIKDLRVDKSQPKTLKPNEADKNLASIMLYGHRYSDLSNGEYIDDNLSTITNPAEMQSEAELLAYRILNDFMFDMDELSFYEDILLESPEYASILSTNENPVKEFFENDIFEQADKEKFEITPEQKQEAQKLYSQYLNTVFPDSKVKDIVYHGSKSKFEKFDKSKLGSNTNPNKEFPQFNDSYLGFHFTGNPEYYKGRFEFGSKYEKNLNEYAVILNIQKPKDIADKNEFSQNNIQFIKPEDVKNNDSIIYDYLDTVDFSSGKKVNKYTNNYVVFEPEQIHILLSKQDIEGFKDFVQGKQYMVDNSETQYSKKENKVKPLADRKGVTYNDINNINVFC